MVKIYNFNDNPLSFKNGAYGGLAGDKDGILINGEEWMLKYPKNLLQMEGENASYSTAPLSEYLGSHVYGILGYDVHETKLGEKNGKLVVACKDFAVDKMLLEIRTLKNHTGKELADILEGTPDSSMETHVVNLQELLLHLDKNPLLKTVDGVKERFFEQSVIDVFINNNDRNNGNWGILRERGKQDCLAPIFDNGGSFSTKMPDEKVKRILKSDEMVNNTINVLTAYGEGKHSYSAKKYFQAVMNIPEFQEAVKKVVPLIKEKLPDIKNMIDEIPETYLLSDGRQICIISDVRKIFYKNQLDIRLEKLLQPVLEQVVDIQINKLEREQQANMSFLDKMDHCKKIGELSKIKHLNENKETKSIVSAR